MGGGLVPDKGPGDCSQKCENRDISDFFAGSSAHAIDKRMNDDGKCSKCEAPWIKGAHWCKWGMHSDAYCMEISPVCCRQCYRGESAWQHPDAPCTRRLASNPTPADHSSTGLLATGAIALVALTGIFVFIRCLRRRTKRSLSPEESDPDYHHISQMV